MAVIAKQAYYADTTMRRGLAARYWRQFSAARTVLDLGCGAGDFGRFRPSDEVEVHGIDIDAAAVEQAARFERAVCADIETAPLPYAEAMFDAVLAKDIFEHVQDCGRLAREAYRVTRPGGVLVASVVMARPSRVWADYTHVRGFSREAARLLLADAGFTVEAIWRMGPVPMSARVGAISLVPAMLSLPPFDWLWGASWELRARR